MKKLNVFTSLAGMVLFVTLVFTTSCSSDEFFGFEEEDTDIKVQEGLTKSNVSYLSYIDLEKTNCKIMDSIELRKYEEAIQRMVIYNDNGLVNYMAKSSSEINISSNLYNSIVASVQYTNNLLRKHNNIGRVKTQNREGSSNYDCVPVSVSNMGRNAPAYRDACRACTEEDYGWRLRGYVHANKVGPIIRHFHDVTTCTAWYGSQYKDFENCVLLVNDTHAVNAIGYTPQMGIAGSIQYQDNQNNGAVGVVPGNMIYAIFVFKDSIN